MAKITSGAYKQWIAAVAAVGYVALSIFGVHLHDHSHCFGNHAAGSSAIEDATHSTTEHAGVYCLICGFQSSQLISDGITLALIITATEHQIIDGITPDTFRILRAAQRGPPHIS